MNKIGELSAYVILALHSLSHAASAVVPKERTELSDIVRPSQTNVLVGNARAELEKAYAFYTAKDYDNAIKFAFQSAGTYEVARKANIDRDYIEGLFTVSNILFESAVNYENMNPRSKGLVLSASINGMETLIKIYWDYSALTDAQKRTLGFAFPKEPIDFLYRRIGNGYSLMGNHEKAVTCYLRGIDHNQIKQEDISFLIVNASRVGEEAIRDITGLIESTLGDISAEIIFEIMKVREGFQIQK